MAPPKKSRGRRKVEMKKISKESNLQVTFSKRRTGLFKKASELSTLCGAEVAIIVFSPADKAFSFGHPNADAVVDRYLHRAPPPPQPAQTMQIIEAHRHSNIRDLNARLTEVMNQLEAEKKRAEELNKMRKAMEENYWFAGGTDKMTREELEKFKVEMEDLKRKLTRETDRHLILNASNEADQFYGFNSSVSNLVPPPLGAPAAPQVFPQQMLQQPIITQYQNPPQMLKQPTMMSQNPMFDGNMMPLPPHGGFNFNNMGGYGPGLGFY